MNILFLCADRGVPIRGHKGAAVHVRAMVDAFAELGHRVTLLTPRPGPEDGPAPRGRLVHVPMPPAPTEIADPVAAREARSQAVVPALFQRAQEVLAQEPHSLIYERHSLWSDVGARLAETTGVPFVLEVNAPLREEAARYRQLTDPHRARQVERRQFQAATAIAVVSEPLREYVIRQGAAPERVHVLPNGVDPVRFHPAVRGGAIRHRYGLGGKIVVGFAGRARPWHDLPTLFRAFRRLWMEDPRYHLLLVGQMPPDLPARLAVLGLDEAVTLTGPVPHHQVPEHLAAMDVAVSPHADLEDFYFSPLKLYEYLACGVPTVAADLGQSARLLWDNQAGLLYPPGDDQALARCIRWLVTHPAEARQLAWQGAVRVLEDHTWQGNARQVLRWAHLEAPPPSRRPSGPSRKAPSLPILDWKLRQRLYRATRPDLAGTFLAQALPAFGKRGPERLVRVEAIHVLKYKPGRRCVLGYELMGRRRGSREPTHHRVIGKVFRDERGRRLDRLQRLLWENGFGPDARDGIHVAEPLGYAPKMRMQLQAWVQGRTLNQLVRVQDIRPTMAQTAQGLAKFHSLPVPLPVNGDGPVTLKRYGVAEEVANLDRFLQELTQVRPSFAREATRLRDALQQWASRLPPPPAATPIHRDFYYSQVLVQDRGRLTLIDFDLMALGDPALDVANFAAHLVFLGMEKLGDAQALVPAGRLFLESYVRCREPEPSFWDRFRFYQAATFFRLLKVVAPRPRLVRLFDDVHGHVLAALERGDSLFWEEWIQSTEPV